MRNFRKIQSLSLDTAMRIFRVKIVPIMTYGIHIIWDYLKMRDLRLMENVEPLYLKKTLDISTYTPSRYAYLLTRELS